MRSTNHLEKVNHNIIRYANVWEDPILLIEGLDIQSNHKVLSIASAGDNSFALAAQGPELIVAIDINQVQLFVTELKKVAISNMEREAFVKFIGFIDDPHRLKDYKLIKKDLSQEARDFWDSNTEIINQGVVNAGKFERYLATFAKKILPLIHSKKKVDLLFDNKTEKEQSQFYENEWNTWRWRFFFKLFFSKRIMGWLGRDPAFLKQVDVNVGRTIFQKAGAHLSSKYAIDNSFLRYCLTGSYGDLLPLYAQEELFGTVKENLDCLKIESGYAQDASIKYGKFHRFNLSNIFEYMSEEIFAITAQSMVECAHAGARFAYWNLMVERKMSDKVFGLEQMKDHELWAERDKGFFYMQFILERFVR